MTMISSITRSPVSVNVNTTFGMTAFELFSKGPTPAAERTKIGEGSRGRILVVRIPEKQSCKLTRDFVAGNFRPLRSTVLEKLVKSRLDDYKSFAYHRRRKAGPNLVYTPTL